MGNRWWVVGALVLGMLGCSDAEDEEGSGAEPPETTDAVEDRTTTTEAALPAGGPAFAVEPGTAVVEAGGERFEYIVFECLLDEETGSPARRLALSASDTEPFVDAESFLNVNLLVSQVVDGHEEHVIELFTIDAGVDLGAADLQLRSRGGPAPDDWIHIDEDAGVVYGEGFELWSTSADDDTVLEDGVLVADCPSAGADQAD